MSCGKEEPLKLEEEEGDKEKNMTQKEKEEYGKFPIPLCYFRSTLHKDYLHSTKYNRHTYNWLLSRPECLLIKIRTEKEKKEKAEEATKKAKEAQEFYDNDESMGKDSGYGY